MNNIIFHLPYMPEVKRPSGSQLRPLKMLDAFRSLGYNVDVVMGDGKQRKRQIRRIKDKIRKGVRYSFLYSESSTMPTLLTDKHHLPLNPFLDFSFIKFCKNRDIKTGVFYRDIYWAFEVYKSKLPFYKFYYTRVFYKYDLKKYNRVFDKVYLPSIEMAKHVPIVYKDKFDSLPPGHDNIDLQNVLIKEKSKKGIRLLYVGGVNPNYQLHLLLEVVRRKRGFELILCTRKKDWDEIKEEYEPLLANNIKIVHLTGKELVDMYKEADIAMLFVKPSMYRNFAFPIKLIEYIGYGKPIIASRETLAGSFVKQNDIGWTIDYSEKALEDLLLRIEKDVEVIDKKVANVLKIKNYHSWINRAKKVESDLKQ